MKGKVIDKQIIESIVRKDNVAFVDQVFEKLDLIVSNAVDELSHQIAYINLQNTVFQPVNELLTDSFTDNSKFVYFLGVDSAQLELNTINSTNIWKNIKNRVIMAWQNRKKKKKKRKKKQQDETGEIKYDFDPAKYNIYKLCEDLQTAIARYCAKTSIVYLEGTRLRIIGKEDFGPNTQILIYPVIYNGEVYKYYTGKKKGFLDVDIDARVEKLNQKYDKVGDRFSDMIKVFNVLYYFANKQMPNQIFIESLLYSCPDELFDGDSAYGVFVKIINYLTMSSIKNIPSLTNPDETIFTDKLSAASGLGYERFINQFVYLNEKQTAKPKDRPDNNMHNSKGLRRFIKKK